MNAKEIVIYLYEHGHTQRYEHHKIIMEELNKPITEHPDVQKLISKQVQLQAKYDTINQSHELKDEALRKIDNWAKAYPLEVFPEPDFKKVHEILKAAGISLDAVSASNMRHVINGIKGIVEQALAEAEKIK